MPNNIHELVSELLVDTKGSAEGGLMEWTADSSLWAFGPELVLCATIVLMLLVRVIRIGPLDLPGIDRSLDRNIGFSLVFLVAFFGSVVAFIMSAPSQHLLGSAEAGDPTSVTRMEIFTGMLVYDTFSVYIRAVLLLFAVLFIVFTKLSGIPDREDGPDIYTLVLGATIGMCLMATANHLLMVFMAVEMASVPSYVLAGMFKGRRVGSEAALKYSVYGAGAAGVMLYGISLIAGLLNTAHLPTMASQLAVLYPEMGGTEKIVLALGGLMIMVGLAFKLSAVPFHFWCPDVFEGASAEVNAFLSVASKAAALALLIRVAVGFGTIPQEGVKPGQRTEQMAKAASEVESVSLNVPPNKEVGLWNVSDEPVRDAAGQTATADSRDSLSREEKIKNLAPVRDFIGKMIALFAVVTCTFGNLAAYGQTNIKRLMAYSTIAHAGYMMMPVPVVMVMAGSNPAVAQSAIAALCIYIGVYLFMNLGAFAIIAFLRNAMRSEEIADYAGLVRRCPVTVVCFTIILFSLVGMPPLAGFIGKFAIFASLADGYRITSAAVAPANYLLVLLLVGGINTAISLFYYLRVVKVMTFEPEPADREPFEFGNFGQPAFVALTAGMTVFLFFFWGWLNEMGQTAARYLL